MIVVDVLDNFIANLDYDLVVEGITYDVVLDISTITVKDYLFARPYLMLTIGGIEYRIETVDYSLSTMTVLGDVTLETVFTLPTPMFAHGTPYAINSKLDRGVTYPFVYLLEIIKEVVPDDLDSRYETIPAIRLFFLDEANFKDWDTDQLYSEVIIPQRAYVDYVFKQIRKSNLFGYPSNIELTTFAKFGQYQDTSKGVLNSLFNKQLSGVEISMNLPIVKKGCY